MNAFDFLAGAFVMAGGARVLFELAAIPALIFIAIKALEDVVYFWGGKKK